VDSSRGTILASDSVEGAGQRRFGKESCSAVSEQAHQRRDDPILLRADGLYYDTGIFDEAVVYYDGEAVYFPTWDKASDTVSFSYVTLGKITCN
jgi:hypothetical protein